MLEAGKITRPRQMYTGALERAFVPLGRRGDASAIPNHDEAASHLDVDALVLEETARYGGYQREVKAKAMGMR